MPSRRRNGESRLHLLDLGPEVTLLSAAALAEQLGTSDATVVRTAKALGYGGLAELRRALATYGDNPPLPERLRRTLEQTPGDELFASAIHNHFAALESLTRNVSPEAFQSAVDILQRCNRVVWRGVGPSAHLAEYGRLITQRIGKPSGALVHTGTSFADELLTLAPKDAVVVFAYGRLQSHVRVLLEQAEMLAVPVVLITDTLGRRLEPSVAVTLECGRGAPWTLREPRHDPGGRRSARPRHRRDPAGGVRSESGAAQRAPCRARRTADRRRHALAAWSGAASVREAVDRVRGDPSGKLRRALLDERGDALARVGGA